MPDRVFLSLFALALQFSLPLSAQDPLPGGAASLQQKTEEWIKTKRLLSEEAATWETERASMAELDAIRAKESAQLDEFVKAAGSRVAELATKKEAFAQESSDLKAWRSNLESDLSALESELRPLLSRFPPPLREKVEESILRLENPEENSPFQNRTRDILLILQASIEFQNAITLDSEIREIGGERREVEVLYLGMTQAWYVDASGRHSGSGIPSDKGWIWEEDPSLAARVRSAIEIQSNRATPAFVELPLQNGSSGEAEVAK